jgi:hypothetical protein
MGFRIQLPPTYEAEVTVAYPVEGGRVHKAKFFAVFRRLAQAELEALMADVAAKTVTDRDVLGRVLVGWRGVEDEDGRELPFNDATRDQLLALHPAQPSIARAFFESISGAREKN